MAEQYAQNAEDTWNDFQTRYLGAYSVAPVTSTTGALYFNSVSNTMFVWNGTSWQTADFNEFTNFTATGTTTARNLVTRMTDVVNVKDFGAVGDGVTDNTPAFTAMISFLNGRSNGVSGGGLGYIPQGRYRINGILPALNTNVGIYGEGTQATIIDFRNGSNDCFILGNTSTQTRGQTISDMYLESNFKTGGSMIVVQRCFNAKISRVQTENNFVGIDIKPRCNGIILEDLFVTATQGTNPVCLKWVAGSTNADRSDVLVIRNVILSGQWSNATCFEWDGAAYTADVHTLRMLHAKYGMVVKNTAASSSFFPSFLNAHNIQAEGFKECAIWIQGGSGFKITGSDINNLTGDPSQGSADEYALRIDGDVPNSYTRGIEISDTRIGGCQKSGIYSTARDIQLSNVIFYTTSYAGSGLYPVVKLAVSGSNISQKVVISNMVAEEFGGFAQASYGIEIDSGASSISINNLNANSVVTGAINDFTSGEQVSAVGVYGPSNIPFGLIHSVSQKRTLTQGDNIGGVVEKKVVNISTSNNSRARSINATTGIANAFWIGELNNGTGSPFWQEAGGAAVTTAYQDVNTTIFRTNAGVEKARIVANGIQLKSFTVGTLPSAATAAQIIYVSDGTSNKRFAISDGTNWRFPDGNIVS